MEMFWEMVALDLPDLRGMAVGSLLGWANAGADVHSSINSGFEVIVGLSRRSVDVGLSGDAGFGKGVVARVSRSWGDQSEECGEDGKAKADDSPRCRRWDWKGE